MGEQIIIDVKSSSDKKKTVTVKEDKQDAKYKKYSRMLKDESKILFDSLGNFFLSGLKVLWYALIVFGCLLKSFGNKNKGMLDTRNDKQKEDDFKTF